MKRLDRLTPEQEARMADWAREWIAIGLSTEPANRERAERAYRDCYRFAGLNSDVPIVWVDSPLAGALAASLARGLLQGEAVFSAVGSAVDQFKIEWHYWLGGAFWAAWPAMESFFREVCGLDHGKCQEATAYAETIKTAGYWWPNENFIIACDRPREINLDRAGRLHGETGPSIAWRDGYTLWHWHGVAVPSEWIVDRETLTAAVALGQQNTERRRVACEIMGWARVLEETGARVVKSDPDPMIGTLLQCDLPDAPGKKFLRVRCGTGREFVIPVPREMETPRQANAWTYGRTAENYNPEVRT